jgi:hypothetical protein
MPYGRARDVGAAHRACTLLAPYRPGIALPPIVLLVELATSSLT